jgi:hypothetical protein
MTINLTEKRKKLLITIIAGILGNFLALLSSMLTPMHPQVCFDFSHLATFMIAVAFGPGYGFLAGAIASLHPYFHYAVWGLYGPFFGLAIVFGKAMTGFFCGLLRDKMPTYLAISLAYIPESLFTLGFSLLMSIFLPAGAMSWEIISSILMEGWVEVIIFAFVIDNIVRRKIIETAILMLEIFIIMFLVHKEFIETLLLLLLITLLTLILFEIIEPLTGKKTKDRQAPTGSPNKEEQAG